MVGKPRIGGGIAANAEKGVAAHTDQPADVIEEEKFIGCTEIGEKPAPELEIFVQGPESEPGIKLDGVILISVIYGDEGAVAHIIPVEQPARLIAVPYVRLYPDRCYIAVPPGFIGVDHIGRGIGVSDEIAGS